MFFLFFYISQSLETLMESKLNERKSKKQASSNTIAVTAGKTKYEDKIKKQNLEVYKNVHKRSVDIFDAINQNQSEVRNIDFDI